MKSLLLAFLALCSCVVSHSQYDITLVSSDGTDGKMGKFSFLNENTGYFFSGQKILKTTDGGDTWNVFLENFDLIKPTGATHMRGQFLTENIGWVVLQKLDMVNGVNDSSYLYKTSDGGQNWTLLHVNPPNSVADATPRFSDCFFKDENHGWVFGWGLLQSTEDGGLTWNNLYLNDTNVSNNRVITDMCMNSSSELFVSGWGSWIMKFTGNGSDLTTQHYYNGGPVASDDYYLNGVTFLNSDTGFVASRHSTVKRTFNGGTTWVDLLTGFQHDNNEITIAPDNTIWLASGDYCNNTGCYHSSAILYSTDLGNTWTALVDQDLVNNRFLHIVWPSENYGFASTVTGKIHKITKTGAGLDETAMNFSLFPNPAKTTFTVQLKQGTLLSVELQDVNGKLLLSSDHNIIDVSSLPTGMYFVCVKTDQRIFMKKILKE